MSNPAAPLKLSKSQLETLEAIAKSSSNQYRLVIQAKALLLANKGIANEQIARDCNITTDSVRRWRKRFDEHGLSNFGEVLKGRGRKHSIPDSKIEEVVKLTLETKPEGETHWSVRTMAKETGLSKSTIQRIWSSRGIKPHLVKTFKVSNDPKFEEKLIDVVGLYLNPPDKAVVLCMDEKSSIQALDRTQPSLPIKKGRAGTMTHDYKRNGTTTLFAALNVLDGTVTGECMKKHRHEEFLKFLKKIDKEVPEELQVHLILDNYATHKHNNIKLWLDKHPRFHFHFTPTSSSWLNLVERWFRDITDKAIRRGVFKSVPDLIKAIEVYINKNNKDPKPFIWTKSAEAILEKVKRGRVALEHSATNTKTLH